MYEIRAPGAGRLAMFTRRTEPLLVVEPEGVRLGPAAVAWPSVRQIAVAPVPGTGDVEVGLRLWPSAPLPYGVPSMVFDPSRPRAAQVRQRVAAGRIDVRRFIATVRALAPPAATTVCEPAPDPDPRRPPATGRSETAAAVEAVRLRTGGRVFLRTPSLRGADYRHRFTPHPVVRFDLPDGRHVVTETSAPGTGEPGERVVVTYDNADPTHATVVGPRPRARWLRTA